VYWSSIYIRERERERERETNRQTDREIERKKERKREQLQCCNFRANVIGIFK
jgi:hypothetical protein